MTIPYGKHNITEEDIESVITVLKSNNLTQGPTILEFEKKFANYVGAKYAIAVSNGTAALHLSTLVLNLKSADKVITTPITFAATANAVRYCDGEVIFSDINRDTYLLDYNKVELLLENSNPGTYKGLIIVNFAGRVADFEKFRKLANKYNLWIIEDACHSPGGYFLDSLNQKQNSGNGTFTDLSIFSFHPVKHIAAGEGGMITTNNQELYQRLLNLRTHGIQQDPLKKIKNDGQWYYEMQELGYNYRLTDIQAALAMSQLNRADWGLQKRGEIAKKYDETFKDLLYIKKFSKFVPGHAFHLYIIEVESRNELYQYLRTKGIFTQIHYIPLNLMPYYQTFGNKVGDMKNAEDYYKRCLSIPIYPTLTIVEQEFVIQSIKEFYEKSK